MLDSLLIPATDYIVAVFAQKTSQNSKGKLLNLLTRKSKL
jgi:hypothetical protein